MGSKMSPQPPRKRCARSYERKPPPDAAIRINHPQNRFPDRNQSIPAAAGEKSGLAPPDPGVGVVCDSSNDVPKGLRQTFVGGNAEGCIGSVRRAGLLARRLIRLNRGRFRYNLLNLAVVLAGRDWNVFRRSKPRCRGSSQGLWQPVWVRSNEDRWCARAEERRAKRQECRRRTHREGVPVEGVLSDRVVCFCLHGVTSCRRE